MRDYPTVLLQLACSLGEMNATTELAWLAREFQNHEPKPRASFARSSHSCLESLVPGMSRRRVE